MENVTLGQIALVVAFIVGLITGVKYLAKTIKEVLTGLFKDEMSVFNKKVDEIQKTVDRVDMESTKNYLVSTLPMIDRGEADEITKQRFWEQYQHYTEKGGNSYIKSKVEKLHSEGKL